MIPLSDLIMMSSTTTPGNTVKLNMWRPTPLKKFDFKDSNVLHIPTAYLFIGLWWGLFRVKNRKLHFWSVSCSCIRHFTVKDFQASVRKIWRATTSPLKRSNRHCWASSALTPFWLDMAWKQTSVPWRWLLYAYWNVNFFSSSLTASVCCSSGKCSTSLCRFFETYNINFFINEGACNRNAVRFQLSAKF